MPHAVDVAEDGLGLNDDQLAVVSAAVALEPLPVPDQIAFRGIEAGPGNEAGHVRFESRTGPKIDRLTAYRFHRTGKLNEHLFHIWPAPGYDYPILTTVLFEMRGQLVLGADLIPVPDVVFERDYYGRCMLGYAELLAEYWPRLVPHRLGPDPAPNPYFTNQIGSTLSVLEYLTEDATDVSRAFLLDLTRLWTELHALAEPVPAESAARTEERRLTLQRRAYKGLDYHSPASDSLAAVLGWEGANLMFDGVFGPDDPPQPLDRKRTYLNVTISPGTPKR